MKLTSILATTYTGGTHVAIFEVTTKQCSSYRGDGGSPHCSYQSPPLFVFLTSQGTVFAPGTASAHYH